MILQQLLVCVSGVSATEQNQMKHVIDKETVTLESGETNYTSYLMTWHFNDACIAEINANMSKICTDVQCNNGTERFRHRLKLDHQTGSLTIMNTRTTDSGEYKLQIIISNSSFCITREKRFNVTVFCEYRIHIFTVHSQSCDAVLTDVAKINRR